MLEHDALCGVMTGSGAAVFGLFPTRAAAEQACTALKSWCRLQKSATLYKQNNEKRRIQQKPSAFLLSDNKNALPIYMDRAFALFQQVKISSESLR